MIEIDGSGGGGQILRNSLAFSLLEDEPFRMTGIRGNRPDPGLKPQHLTGIRLVQELCDATVDGGEQGSTELTFRPGSFDPHDVPIDIGTAGSISLLFQTILPLCYLTDEPFTVKATGGTDVKWSPPIDYLRQVTLPLVGQFGADLSCRVGRRGFYPAGGGRASLTLEPSEPGHGFLDTKGEPRRIEGSSIASQHLRGSKVAERQRSHARREIRSGWPSIDLDIGYEYVQSRSPGSSLVLVAEYGETILGADALGEKGKRSETVAEEATSRLLKDMRSPACVDSHMADQIIPFLAMGGGRVVVPGVTDHVATAIETAEQFTGEKVEKKEEEGAVVLSV